MPVKLERDWPVIAAALLGLVALYLLARPRTTLTQQPIVVGGGGASQSADYQAALQAQVALETGRQQAVVSLFNIAAQREMSLAQTSAQLAAIQAQTNAQLRAAQAQAQAQQQASTLGLIGTIITGIFGLFSWETTNRALQGKLAASARLRSAYGAVDRFQPYRRALQSGYGFRPPEGKCAPRACIATMRWDSASCRCVPLQSPARSLYATFALAESQSSGYWRFLQRGQAGAVV